MSVWFEVYIELLLFVTPTVTTKCLPAFSLVYIRSLFAIRIGTYAFAIAYAYNARLIYGISPMDSPWLC